MPANPSAPKDALECVAQTIAGAQTAPKDDEINSIPGVEGARPGVDYTLGLRYGTYADRGNPNAIEIQAVIDSINTQLDIIEIVVQAIAGAQAAPNNDEINSIYGVEGARPGVDYVQGFVVGSYEDPANPTPNEIQTVIDTVNNELSQWNLVMLKNELADAVMLKNELADAQGGLAEAQIELAGARANDDLVENLAEDLSSLKKQLEQKEAELSQTQDELSQTKEQEEAQQAAVAADADVEREQLAMELATAAKEAEALRTQQVRQSSIEGCTIIAISIEG